MLKSRIPSAALPMAFVAALFPRLANADALYTAIDLSAPAYTFSLANGVTETQQVGSGLLGAQYHALLWSGSASTVLDLNPSGFQSSQIAAITGSVQVGYGVPSGVGASNHALMWNGSATNFIDLNPANFSVSQATAVSSTQEVGYGSGTATSNNTHALLWNGSASGVIDLNPTGFTSSHATDIDGTREVGFGVKTTGGTTHALVWSGSASSFLDLNPISFAASVATGISGTQEVGYGNTTGGNDRAMLWQNSSSVFTILNPVGFDESRATATNGPLQVGYGDSTTLTAGNQHALLWSGTAASVIDLQQYLSADFISSAATGIDSSGDVVGFAIDTDFTEHAILWQATPTPEPATLLPAFGAMTALVIRRKAKWIISL
jgi:hypothetical protein